MDLKEFYEMIDGDYKNILERFQSEKFILKFVLKFPQDNVYSLLCSGIEEKKYDDAFRAAHTMKGICLNLSFGVLFESSSELCEALRDKTDYDEEKINSLFKCVKKDYEHTLMMIEKLQSQCAG